MSTLFNWLLEKEPELEEGPEEEEEEEEEGEVEPPIDEQTLFYNREITECFDLFDKGGGKMEARHLARALDCLGIGMSPYEAEEVAEHMETNGFITFDKFHPYAFERMSAADPAELLRNAFQAFDADKEGILHSDRLKKWLTTLGDPLTDKEAKDFFKLADPAGRGVFGYDDMVTLLLKG